MKTFKFMLLFIGICALVCNFQYNSQPEYDHYTLNVRFPNLTIVMDSHKNVTAIWISEKLFIPADEFTLANL